MHIYVQMYENVNMPWTLWEIGILCGITNIMGRSSVALTENTRGDLNSWRVEKITDKPHCKAIISCFQY